MAKRKAAAKSRAVKAKEVEVDDADGVAARPCKRSRQNRRDIEEKVDRAVKLQLGHLQKALVESKRDKGGKSFRERVGYARLEL